MNKFDVKDSTISGLEYTDEEKYLFALVTGFMRSKLMSVALECDLFYFLSLRPRSFEDLQRYLNFPERSLRIFLDTLLNLKLIGLTEKNSFQNTGISSKYLVKGKLSYIGGSFDLFNSLYDGCKDLKSIFTQGKPSNKIYSYLFKPADNLEETDIKEYTRQMHETNGHPVMTLTEFYDFEESRVVLDLGGGTGKISQTIVAQYPHIEAILFDLPAVCERAREEIKGFWLRHRVQIYPGDFFKDPLPQGFDTAVMMRITQDWSLEKIRLLFRKVFDALPPGGKIIIYEIFRDDDPKKPGDASLISLLLLLNTPEGMCRSQNEISGLLEEVGFEHLEYIHTIYIYHAIIGVKPEKKYPGPHYV